ncbi:MAG: VOC family protein [Acidimicrobiia bacterium]
MPERTQYVPGTPSWIDIGTDVEAATQFYGPLFDWDSADAGPVEETGGYGFFTKGGKLVAGYGPQQHPGPPYWTSYISVADADDVAKRVEAAGGKVIMSPMEVMTAGRMAVFQDPQGAFISAWEPKEHQGAQLVNEPGTLFWNELNTRDVDGSKRFYSAVFDWDPITHEGGPMPYTEFRVGGNSVAGMMAMPPMVPAEVPPHWLVYFAVEDTDATVARAKELGGAVRMPPMDITGVGRISVLADSKGATFAVIQPAAKASG